MAGNNVQSQYLFVFVSAVKQEATGRAGVFTIGYIEML